jgi:hypothetical protein
LGHLAISATIKISVLAVNCRQLDSSPSSRAAKIGTSAHVGHENAFPRTAFDSRTGEEERNFRSGLASGAVPGGQFQRRQYHDDRGLE